MGKRRNKERQQNKRRANPAWEDIKKENKSFEEYYKGQKIVPDETWDEFVTYCRKDLPSTFRITKMRGHAQDLLKKLKENYISKINSNEVNVQLSEGDDGEESINDLFMEPISWYPDELAWNSNLSRRFIRRSETLQELHRFLVEDNECGAITRQEAVSMIPPLLLDVKSHHLVLDLCAAPGSKTAQIIECMHDACNDGSLPTGAVFANDADHKRCYMLTHQAKRLNTHCVVITNHDASIYPKLFKGPNELAQFDRVLCDVPCSGDGTIRKNPLLWHKWNARLGVGLHRLQSRILLRGLELLKVGGRLVYSTCSFNPIENEAVLANVLSKVDGAVEIVDVSNELTGLVRVPGMTTWKVFDRNNQEFKSIDDVNCSPTEGYKASMFPPSSETAELLKLKNCMRIYPHLQNTGGFFIAVLVKKDELPWQKAKRIRNMKYLPWEEEEKFINQASTESPSQHKNENNVPSQSAVKSDNVDQPRNSPKAKRMKRGSIREDPYIFLEDDDSDLNTIRNFYGISDDLLSRQLLVRSDTIRKRHIYLVSKSVHDIMFHNKGSLKIINTGVRIATRSPFRAGLEQHGTEYRLVQDGLGLIYKYLSERVIEIPDDDMITLITYNETNIELLSTQTVEYINLMDMGCVIWHCKSKEGSRLSADVWLCGHNGRKTMQCMLSKEERKHFLRILGVPIPEELKVKVKGESWGDSIENQNENDATHKDDTVDANYENVDVSNENVDVSNENVDVSNENVDGSSEIPEVGCE